MSTYNPIPEDTNDHPQTTNKKLITLLLVAFATICILPKTNFKTSTSNQVTNDLSHTNFRQAVYAHEKTDAKTGSDDPLHVIDNIPKQALSPCCMDSSHEQGENDAYISVVLRRIKICAPRGVGSCVFEYRLVRRRFRGRFCWRLCKLDGFGQVADKEVSVRCGGGVRRMKLLVLRLKDGRIKLFVRSKRPCRTRRPTNARSTFHPSPSPSKNPSATPTKTPTEYPTVKPTEKPSSSPSNSPSKNPTRSPSRSPSRYPSASPTRNPTQPPVCTSPIAIDTILILDSSHHVNPTNFDSEQELASHLIQSMGAHQRVGIINYSGSCLIDPSNPGPSPGSPYFCTCNVTRFDWCAKSKFGRCSETQKFVFCPSPRLAIRTEWSLNDVQYTSGQQWVPALTAVRNMRQRGGDTFIAMALRFATDMLKKFGRAHARKQIILSTSGLYSDSLFEVDPCVVPNGADWSVTADMVGIQLEIVKVRSFSTAILECLVSRDGHGNSTNVVDLSDALEKLTPLVCPAVE